VTPIIAVSPVQILVVVAITQVKAKENPSGEGFREQVNLPRLSRWLSAKAIPFIFWKEKTVEHGIFLLFNRANLTVLQQKGLMFPCHEEFPVGEE